MKINLIVKILIATLSHLLIVYSDWVMAWSIGEQVIEGSEFSQDKVLQLKAISQSDDVTKDTVSKFEKKETTLNAEEQNALEFRKAIVLQQEGKQRDAEKIFLDILRGCPEHLNARAELANIYLKNKRDAEAETLLEEGLMQAENYPEFLRLMSIVHDRKNEPHKALTLLLKVPESYKQNKDYIALLGHIYQQTGRYALARQQYFRLMHREPKNPIWLFGVSIALDSEGSKEAALEGYKRLKKENIDIDILKYVEDRIEKLTG